MWNDSQRWTTFIAGEMPPTSEMPTRERSARAAHDPLGACVELPLGRLGAADRQGQVLAEPDIGRGAMLVHRFLHPVEIEFFERPPEIQRLLARVVVVRVEHQLDLGATASRTRRRPQYRALRFGP